MVAALIDRLTFRNHVLNMNGNTYRLKAAMQDKNWRVAQLFVNDIVRFFVVVSGSKIHEHVDHFFIDIYSGN